MLSIDERLAQTDFPLPAIRQINKAKHPNAISLGLGELKDFKVDVQVIDALVASLQTDGANYSQNGGLPQLRIAVATEQQKADGFAYTIDHVVITIGVQNALYTTIYALAKLGAKRVLIPEINFGIYKKIPSEFNLQVIPYKLTDDFGICLDSLSDLLKPDDIVIINSPANPTGRVFSTSEMQNLAKLFTEKLTDGFAISDEIYSKLVYTGDPQQTFSKFFSRTIVLDGISKSAAAAGLRVGWVITQNQKLAQAITSHNATILSCPPTANQYAAIPVVIGSTQQTIVSYNTALESNCKVATKLLKEANIPFNQPSGSFYVFPKIQHLINISVREFCLIVAAHEQGVVVIPGDAFGSPEHVRISLASDQIALGMKRLISFIKEYTKN